MSDGQRLTGVPDYRKTILKPSSLNDSLNRARYQRRRYPPRVEAIGQIAILAVDVAKCSCLKYQQLHSRIGGSLHLSRRLSVCPVGEVDPLIEISRVFKVTLGCRLSRCVSLALKKRVVFHQPLLEHRDFLLHTHGISPFKCDGLELS